MGSTHHKSACVLLDTPQIVSHEPPLLIAFVPIAMYHVRIALVHGLPAVRRLQLRFAISGKAQEVVEADAEGGGRVELGGQLPVLPPYLAVWEL